MDERLPSGESMYDLTRRMMSQPQTPDTPSAPYQQYQNLTLPPIGDAPTIDPRYVGDDSAMTAPAAPAVPAAAILSPRAQLESQIADVQGRR
jgi:hypothetical protein